MLPAWQLWITCTEVVICTCFLSALSHLRPDIPGSATLVRLGTFSIKQGKSPSVNAVCQTVQPLECSLIERQMDGTDSITLSIDMGSKNKSIKWKLYFNSNIFPLYNKMYSIRHHTQRKQYYVLRKEKIYYLLWELRWISYSSSPKNILLSPSPKINHGFFLIDRLI